MRVSRDDFESAEFVPGCKYELIDGRLDVSFEPDPAENVVENWLYSVLLAYKAAHPEVVNYVTNKARVVIPGRPDDTIPEPDIAAYVDFPKQRSLRGMKWDHVSPILVCEVLSNDPVKDLERNVELYFEVPSIREYWVVDIRESADEPELIQHRRSRSGWAVKTYSYRSKFTTKLLPGFMLVIDPLS
jgi:Uma2 family endonuclease